MEIYTILYTRKLPPIPQSYINEAVYLANWDC